MQQVFLLIVLGASAFLGCRATRQEPAAKTASQDQKVAAPERDECPPGERYPALASPADAVKPEEKWTGDINGDGRMDLLLRDLGSCSNWGDCPYTLFLQCDSRRIAVWSAYAHQVDIRESETKWKDLLIVQRNEGSGQNATSRRLFRFDGNKYTAVTDLPRR
jgi:hypothetical protein